MFHITHCFTGIYFCTLGSIDFKVPQDQSNLIKDQIAASQATLDACLCCIPLSLENWAQELSNGI